MNDMEEPDELELFYANMLNAVEGYRQQARDADNDKKRLGAVTMAKCYEMVMYGAICARMIECGEMTSEEAWNKILGRLLNVPAERASEYAEGLNKLHADMRRMERS